MRISETQRNAVMKSLAFLPDKMYLSLIYRLKMGKAMNWKNPQTFNEKTTVAEGL